MVGSFSPLEGFQVCFDEAISSIDIFLSASRDWLLAIELLTECDDGWTRVVFIAEFSLKDQ
jgi:hypothetical protein